MTYFIEFILTVALNPIIVVLIGIFLLLGGWIVSKINDGWNWFKTMFFRATALGGMCLATVMIGIGLCTWEDFGGKTDKKDDST